MSSELGGVNIGDYLLNVFEGSPLTIRRYTNGAEAVDPNAGYARTSVDHSCRGYPESTTSEQVDKRLIRDGCAVFGVYGASTALIPRANDVVVDGAGATYVVYAVGGDSTGAVWVVYASPENP